MHGELLLYQAFQPSFSFLNRAQVYHFSHSLVNLNALAQTWIAEGKWRKNTQQV